MNFVDANQSYEKWLRRQMPVIEDDLHLKHEKMRESPFPFLRASFFRWCELWQENLIHFKRAPKVLGVGDLHIENYGTWRDLEGRLIWGINDFDEAATIPYAMDLVRLAVSAQIASSCDHLRLNCKQIVRSILDGYEVGLRSGGIPFVLEEEHAFLRTIATHALRDAKHFFQKLESRFPSEIKPSPAVKKILIKHLPKGATHLAFAHRVAGLGSLGRPRFIVRAEFGGGKIVREAKTLCGSAYLWQQNKSTHKLYYQKIIEESVRMRDPILCFEKNWVIRRLAPHCTKIEISTLPTKLDELRLLTSMGTELANIHFKNKKAILADLKSRPLRHWTDAVVLMTELTMNDWHEWTQAKN